VKFGSALATETEENEIISISGLKGREPKEIKVENLARIIQARVEEILEHVYYEIKLSGFHKKLIGGIVVTGGGAQLKHLVQLVSYSTGMDARIGYPTEYLGKSTVEDIRHPMYATAVGLILKGHEDRKYVEHTHVQPEVKSEAPVTEQRQPIVEFQEPELQQANVSDSVDVDTEENDKKHTKPGWLKNMLSSTRKWFEEDDVSDFQ
jgi:cell division protein FtsA